MFDWKTAVRPHPGWFLIVVVSAILGGCSPGGEVPAPEVATGASGVKEPAAVPPIRVWDIGTAEANIHAGVKYPRFIIEKYFNDPESDEVNRMLFAFAAYNAGPTGVARLRQEAPKYGFDPNQWFRNVEYLMERKAGREPVRYVANIYKALRGLQARAGDGGGPRPGPERRGVRLTEGLRSRGCEAVWRNKIVGWPRETQIAKGTEQFRQMRVPALAAFEVIYHRDYWPDEVAVCAM